MIDFLVTTREDRLKQVTTPIIMVDGTVSGWVPAKQDSHFDHHRPNGQEIQIDEIPYGYPLPKDFTVVTSMVDADDWQCCSERKKSYGEVRLLLDLQGLILAEVLD